MCYKNAIIHNIKIIKHNMIVLYITTNLPKTIEGSNVYLSFIHKYQSAKNQRYVISIVKVVHHLKTIAVISLEKTMGKCLCLKSIK